MALGPEVHIAGRTVNPNAVYFTAGINAAPDRLLVQSRRRNPLPPE